MLIIMICQREGNSMAEALLVKANNRVYNAGGIQTKFDLHWYGQNNFHDIEIGILSPR